MRKWTDEEYERLLVLHEQGLNTTECARALGRPFTSVASKLKYGHTYEGQVPLHQIIEADIVRVPGKVLAERAKRAAIYPRDLTAAIFGDPLPGYSALDKMAGAA
jgi:hypothetical protein